jgi:glycosyltransferase involved in cell wall biosynthesis
MICTAARGGMRSVVEGYLADGLFSRWNIVLLNSHVEGSLSLRLTTAFASFFKLVGLLLTRRVNLVHCHVAMKGSFWRKSLFALVSRLAGVPVVFHLHGSEMRPFVNSQPPFLQNLIGWILKKQSAVVVLSGSWRDYVKTISPNARVEVLPNYIDPPVLINDRRLDAGANIQILFLGLVGNRKGIFDLLPAFKEARTNLPNLQLTIGGNGEVERAKMLANELGLSENVNFVGWVSGDDKRRLLEQAQVYVLPSYNEGLPVSIIEAMGYSLPVISTRVGGIPELIRDGTDGILINAGDQVALSEALTKLASNGTLRSRMGESARFRIEHCFSKEVVLPKLEELYHSMLK